MQSDFDLNGIFVDPVDVDGFRIGASRLEYDSAFNPGLAGAMSCLQIYDRHLTEAEVFAARECPFVEKENDCPQGFEFYDGMCYKVKEMCSAINLMAVDFITACHNNMELHCSSLFGYFLFRYLEHP